MRASDCRLQILGGDVILVRDKRCLDAVAHDTLDVRTAVALHLACECSDVDLGEIGTPPLADVEADDLFTLALIWEVHIEDLIETTLAHELGRQM